MIVSDRHRFIFIHIPKCAGSAIRRRLQPYDDAGGRFSERVVEHPDFGRLDLTHMPLDLLRCVEPEVHGKLAGGDYAGYAILRDPYERFPSAMAQRLKMYDGTEMMQMGAAALRREVDATIRHLAASPADTAPDYIHFHPQVRYVVENGQRRVHGLYTMDRLDRFTEDLSARIGTPLEAVGRANSTWTLRFPALRGPFQLANRAARRVLPAPVRLALRQKLRARLMQRSSADRPEVFETAEVRGFIAEYYAEDIALYREVHDRAPGAPRQAG